MLNIHLPHNGRCNWWYFAAMMVWENHQSHSFHTHLNSILWDNSFLIYFCRSFAQNDQLKTLTDYLQKWYTLIWSPLRNTKTTQLQNETTSDLREDHLLQFTKPFFIFRICMWNYQTCAFPHDKLPIKWRQIYNHFNYFYIAHSASSDKTATKNFR